MAARAIPDCERDLEGSRFVQDIYESLLNLSTQYLSQHFRWPSRAIAEMQLSEVKASLAMGNPDQAEEIANISWDRLAPLLANATEDFRRLYPDRYLVLRRKMAATYVRAVRQTDLSKEFRVVPHTPSDEAFFLAALKAKSNGGPGLLLDYTRDDFSLEFFRDLFVAGRGRRGYFPQPLLFPEGRKELEQAARFDSPLAFNNFVDRGLVEIGRAQSAVAAIEKSKGFIVVSWTAGKPLNTDFLTLLLALAEEDDLALLVLPTQQNFSNLPSVFLENPRIHLMTHSIENSALKISTEPINPDIENPLTEVKKSGRYRPGQTVIVAHPHAMLEILPTGLNSVAPVTLIATGSLNDPFASYSAVSQGRRKEANKGYWKRKAWIFEKGGAQSQFEPDGPKNLWYPRPVSFADDRATGGQVGLIDVFRSFQVVPKEGGGQMVKIEAIDPEAGYLGDFHDPVTDPSFVQALVDDLSIPSNTEMILLSGDTFDNGVISNHSIEKSVELNLTFQRDGLSAQKQVNSVIQVVNAFQQRFPKARWGHIVGNHDEWLNRVLERTPDVHRVINGDFLDELNFAVKTLKFNIWEYLFRHRENILNSILANHPDKKAEILRRILPVYDPSRIEILDRGASLYVGPPHRKNEIGRHGDRVTFGKKSSSLKEQARGMPEGGGVTGHTHRPGMYDEVMDAGTAGGTEPDYGRGFNSGVGQALVLVYPNGTKQLLLFNRRSGTFKRRKGDSLLSPDKFFDKPSFLILPNDNERVNEEEALRPIWEELARLKKLTSG